MKILVILSLFFTHSVFASIDTIWFNANIHTMNDFSPHAEAIAVSDGRIVEIGKNENILKMREFKTKLIDLGGKTLLPGFIETYGSLTGTAIKSIGADLSAVEGKNSLRLIRERLSEFLKNSPYPEDYGVLIGFGYNLKKNHPKKEDLDRISSEIPILVIHKNGETGVMNTKALSLIGLTSLKGEESKGILEGIRLAENTTKLISNLSDRQLIDILLQGEKEYLKQGFTTIQDEGTSQGQIEILMKASKEKKLTLDVVSYLDYFKDDLKSLLEYPYYENVNSNPMYTYHYRLGGYRVRLDEFKDFYAIYEDCLKNFHQVINIAKGSKDIDQMLKSYRKAKIKYPASQIRPVLISDKPLTEKQIKEVEELEIIISSSQAERRAITSSTALKAITKQAAYQYFEERTKGTLEKGKIADFTILSKDPLNSNKSELKKIKVLETIKEGISVYRHPSFKIKNRSYKSN